MVELNRLATRALDVEHHPLASPTWGVAGANGAFPPVLPGDGWDTPVRG